MVAAQIETLVAERRSRRDQDRRARHPKIVEAVADAISRLDLPAPVVDPVLISSAGARLLDPAGERALLSACSRSRESSRPIWPRRRR